MLRLPFSLSAVIVIAGAGIAAPARAEKPSTCEAFRADARVQKHFVVSCDKPTLPFWDCEPAGVWAPLNKQCGSSATGFRDHADCTVAVDGIEGRLTPEHATLFAALSESSREDWTQCRKGPNPSWSLGIEGLGFMRAKDQAGTLVGLLAPEHAAKIGGDAKRMIVQALWRMGARETVDALAAILPTGNSVLEFRYAALAALARWGSDAAVPFCKKALGDRHDETARACAIYLAERRITDALPLMIRNIDKLRTEGLIALGQLGKGNAEVKALLAEKATAGGNDFVPARLALFELGDAKAFKEIQERLKDASTIRGEVLTLAWAADKKAQGAIIAWLTKQEGSLAKEDKMANARAIAVRAQLGDAKAIKALVPLLNGSNEDVRRQALRAIGGTFGTLESSSGRRIVADASLIPVLKAYYDAEQNPSDKAMALGAWADLIAATTGTAAP